MTPELVAAETAGTDHLAAALGVGMPGAWPPEFYDADDLARMSALLADEGNAGWALYYLRERGQPPSLVGVAGFAGAPGADGLVEVGYSILPLYRRRGLASEALSALVTHAFSQPAVRVVAAETYPSLAASIGVLLKNGFQPTASPGQLGILRFERLRS